MPEHSTKKRRRNTTSSSNPKPAKLGIHTLGGKSEKVNRIIPSTHTSNLNSNRQKKRAYAKRGSVAFTGEDDIAGQLLQAVSSNQGAKGNSGRFFRFHFLLLRYIFLSASRPPWAPQLL